MLRFVALAFATAVLGIALLTNLLRPAPAPCGDRTQPTEHSPVLATLSVNAAATRIDDLPTDMYRHILGTNEIVYKRYTKDGFSFEFYVARWAPRNPFIGEAIGHLPEGCWSASGGTCVDARSGTSYRSGLAELKPGEW